ncbi:thiopurine S-methyltransferase [Chromatium okenii]|jgi:thiopurine S-methyltransferase|uniref:Thiopurine S-methyltransferase n=1 Tax=Chromatium okenii TaxID=61644 RepID=A0A2S7XNJ9_9GAMM|nr:thiopurine S-methyltransferase [Chromatium okenii]PQJ95236.1 thiopurine S-methyltransferase [Chromatium okenii]
MTPEFWLERWQQGETGWHLPEINRHLQEFWPQFNLPANAAVLVPLCGKTLDLLWLMSQGLRVIGVELSPLAIEEFLTENGLTAVMTDASPFRSYQVDELTLLCGDFFALTPAHLPEIHAVYDRGALVALPPALRESYAAQLKMLAPNAAQLLITFDYDQQQMAGPPFAVQRNEIAQIFAGKTIIELANFDVLNEAPNLRQRGVTALAEQVWKLE